MCIDCEMIIIIQLINRDMCVRWNIQDKIHFKCTVHGAEEQVLGICFKNSIPRFFFSRWLLVLKFLFPGKRLCNTCGVSSPSVF